MDGKLLNGAEKPSSVAHEVQIYAGIKDRSRLSNNCIYIGIFQIPIIDRVLFSLSSPIWRTSAARNTPRCAFLQPFRLSFTLRAGL